MGSANMVPIGFAGCNAFAIRWVVLVPGPTGSFHHIALLSQRREADLLSQALDLSCSQYRRMTALEDSAPRHDRPCDPRHLVGDGNRGNPGGLSGE